MKLTALFEGHDVDCSLTQKTHVLWFSLMPVSPGTGGGITAYNLLEPNPVGGRVYYVTPRHRRVSEGPFSELRGRVISYPTVHWPNIRPVRGIRPLQRYAAWRNRQNHRLSLVCAPRFVRRAARKVNADVVLMSPQGDIAPYAAIANTIDVPFVCWFMDHYYDDPRALDLVAGICERAAHVFVISDAMRELFTRHFGCRTEVLHNSVDFPDAAPARRVTSSRPLRVLYGGAVNSYYLSIMRFVLDEVKSLAGQVSLDVFSVDAASIRDAAAGNAACQVHNALPYHELVSRLPGYDVLLLLSSFESCHQAIAETSLASKVAEYCAAGRSVLALGPEYAENVRHVQRHNLGVSVCSTNRGDLSRYLLRLKADPDGLMKLGAQAFYGGKRLHDRAQNRTRLWDALSTAAALRCSTKRDYI